jgi:TPR repeat protein
MFYRFFTILCVIFGLCSPLAADKLQDARQAYINGDYAAALAVLEPAAQSGNAMAQNIMGAAYENGNGVKFNTKLAKQWYQKSADQGFDRALYNLGDFYLHDYDDIA